LASVRQSAFSLLGDRLAARQGPVYPLHIGDTWRAPALGLRAEDQRLADLPGLHRYGPVEGIPELIDAVCERVGSRQGLAVRPEQVLISAGATGGLATVIGAIASPGDEVLILAPHWPLIAGIVRTFHAVPVQVPVLDLGLDEQSLAELLQERVTARTVALYLSTPNNPTGQVLPVAWVHALAELARRNDLWLLADEVYEDYVFEGEHAYARPLAPERTFSVHSCSKAYGVAGTRCGYVVGPAEAIGGARKVGTHTVYNAPTPAQYAAVRALRGEADAWVAESRRAYHELGQWTAARLGVAAPQGSTFVFVDVAHALDERGLDGLLLDCVDRGLLVAPGTAFGPYPHHVRVCFTSVEPELVRAGVAILAQRMGR